MALTPPYGETPVPDDDVDSLIPAIRKSLGEPISKAAIYNVEQRFQSNLAQRMITDVLDGKLAFDELVSDHFLRELHRQLYGSIWTWAGVFRKRELNIGVAPWQIAARRRG